MRNRGIEDRLYSIYTELIVFVNSTVCIRLPAAVLLLLLNGIDVVQVRQSLPQTAAFL